MISKERLEDLLRQSAARAGSPVWRRFRPRMETIAARAADLMAQPLREDLARLWNEVSGLHEELGRLRGELHDMRHRQEDIEHHNRLVPEQVAAIEARLGALEADTSHPAISRTPNNAGGDSGESTAVLDDIRAEHRRIRARMTAVALYEERIGRLEKAIADRPAID